MSKLTIIGDPHITPKSLDKSSKLFQQVEDLGYPAVWLGDLLDTKEVIRGKCLNAFYDYFKSSKLNHVLIVGNHDWFNLECLDHSLKPLGSLENVKIIDKVEKSEDHTVMFVPYVHDKQLLKKMIKDTKGKGKITMFGHFDVSGFDYGNGHMCEDGIITKDDFKGFKRVISGHFHKFQNTDNFMYLGTPFSHSFGESNQDKVIAVLDLNTDQIELIPTEFPRHVSLKVDMSSKGGMAKIEKFIELNPTNLIRIQLHGAPEDTTSVDRSKFENYKIKWEDKSESENDTSQTLDESLDNKSQFQEWANNIKKLDSDTVQLGLSILEALNAK